VKRSKSKQEDPYLIFPDKQISISGIKFPLEYLFRGLLVTGLPGSGKTRCILLPLLSEILRVTGIDQATKAGMFIADPKNELAEHIQTLLKGTEREKDLIVLRPGSAYYNPLSSPFLTPPETVEKIISFGSNRDRSSSRPGSDDLFWFSAMRGLLSATLALARALCPPEEEIHFGALNNAFNRIIKFSSFSDARQWLIGKKIRLSAVDMASLESYLDLPDLSTKPCVTSSVQNLIYFWGQNPLKELVQPKADIPNIDPLDVIDSGKIVVVGCSSAAYGGSITPLLLALKEHLFAGLLSRDVLEVTENDSWRPINQVRPVFVIADEFQAYVSPDASTGEVQALDRLRGFKAGYIAATQNLASVHSVFSNGANAAKLIALFANQIFLANICHNTAQHAEFIMGLKAAGEENESTCIAPPLLLKPGRYKPRSQNNNTPKLRASDLALLKTGEFWIRIANGKTVKGNAVV